MMGEAMTRWRQEGRLEDLGDDGGEARKRVAGGRRGREDRLARGYQGWKGRGHFELMEYGEVAGSKLHQASDRCTRRLSASVGIWKETATKMSWRLEEAGGDRGRRGGGGIGRLGNEEDAS